MDKLIKRAGIALAAFGLASSAYAGSFAPVCPCDITIPKYSGGFRIGIEALYFAPTLADNDYATSEFAAEPDARFRTHDVDFDYEWGYKIDLAYLFPGTGNDVMISWTDIEFDDSETRHLGSANALIPIRITNLVAAGISLSEPDDSVRGRYDVDYEAFDLELGQAMTFMDRVTVRFHAGIRYAEVDTKLRVTTLHDVGGPGFTLTETARAEWEGVGIRVGANGAWHLGSGFSLTAALATSVLVGDVDHKISGVYTDESGPTITTSVTTADYDLRVVPNVDSRLGINYKYIFNNQSELELELGYQISNYFDVDHKFSAAGTDVGIHGGYARIAILV